MTKTKKAPTNVMIFINDAMWSMTILLLNKVIRLTANVSLKVIIAVIKSINKETLKVNFEAFFLKTPNSNKNIIESEINISGKTKFKFSILFISKI